jgi:hypothetical protein
MQWSKDDQENHLYWMIKRIKAVDRFSLASSSIHCNFPFLFFYHFLKLLCNNYYIWIL